MYSEQDKKDIENIIEKLKTLNSEELKQVKCFIDGVRISHINKNIYF